MASRYCALIAVCIQEVAPGALHDRITPFRSQEDLVVFDADTVAEGATYDTPTRPAVGIETVFVNGRETWNAGRHMGARAGHIV